MRRCHRLSTNICLTSVTLLFLLGGLVRSQQLTEVVTTNLLMVTGLDELDSPALTLIEWMYSYDTCSSEFSRAIEDRTKQVSSIERPLLQWAALCHVPLDIPTDSKARDEIYWLFRGWVTAQAHDLKAAVPEWQKNPTIARYIGEVAGHILEKEQTEEAFEFARLANAISTEEASKSYSLSRVLCSYHTRAQDWRSALSHCERAATLGSWNKDWHKLGDVYFQLERYSKAIWAFEQADTVVSAYKIGNVQRVQNHFPAAERSYLRAIQLDSDYRPAYLGLIQLYLERGRVCEAQEIVESQFQDICLDQNNQTSNHYCELMAKEQLDCSQE